MNIFKNRLLFYFMAIFLALGLIHPSYVSGSLDSDNINRFSGQNRYQTAVKIAQQLNTGPIQSVIVSSGLNFPDALSGSVLGVQNNAPILLAGKTLAHSQDTIDYIQKNLSVDGTIYLLGGTGVIPIEFEERFAELGYDNVIRLGGNDRYESSTLIAKQLNVPIGTPVSIVFGGNFPDALGMSSFSANKGWPILLSKTNDLSAEIQSFLIEKSPTYVYIAGGTGVISDEVQQKIQELVPEAKIERFAGSNRFETSSLINNYFAPYPSQVYLASGMNYPDALTGSVLAGRAGAPIVLINPKSATIPSEAEKYLKVKLNINSFNVTAIGGTQAVPDHFISQALYGVEREPIFVPSKISGSGFSIQSIPSSPGTLEFNAVVSANIETVLLVIKKDNKEETIRADVVNGTVKKNIYPRLGPGNYSISIYESTHTGQSNTEGASKKQTVDIYYSGTDGSYDTTTHDSLVDIDIPTYEEINWAWLNIVKTDGETRGAMDDYYIPVDGRISHEVFLRYGPGTYHIRVFESTDRIGYNTGPSFTVVNTDVRDLTYIGRSYWVQSDVPEVIELAQQITKGITNDLAKSEAIHNWITANISYNDQYYPGATALLALQYREATSSGYAALTAALHRAVGIQAQVVQGHTIGFGTDPKTWEEIDDPNTYVRLKYWNEILINGEWINVDTLWQYFNINDKEFSATHRKIVLPEGSKTIPW